MSPHNQQTPSAPLPADGTAAATPSYAPPATADGTLFPAAGDRYVLGDEIARGGMGAVYRATDTAFGREVAVKTLLPGQDRMAFVEEARITGQLQHPHIPTVHDLGTLPDGRVFLAMKLIKGETLQHLIGRPDRSINVPAVFEAICQALGYAHSHRVVHRDLKPLNVMVGAFGEVQVMDWGLAKVLSADPSAEATDPTTTPGTAIVSMRAAEDATVDGVAKGTLQYMSPEQARGVVAEIDQRSDVFGLGGILCALLTGKPVYIGNSRLGTALMASNGETTAAFARLDASGADPALVALCKRCLATHKDDRPADGNAVAAEVAGIRADAEERAKQAELDWVRAEEERKRQAEQVRADRARRRLQTWAAAAVGVALVIGTGLSLWQADRANTEAKRADDRAADAEREQREAERQKGLADAAAMRAGAEAKRADDRAAEAVREREAAKASDRNARRMVGRMATVEGLNQLSAGEGYKALAWFVRPRQLVVEDAPIDLVADRLLAHHRYGRLPMLVGMHQDEWPAKVESERQRGRRQIRIVNDDRAKTWTVQIWDDNTSQYIGAPIRHGGKISSATFDRGGLRVVTSSRDGTARVWDATSGRPVTPPLRHDDGVWSAHISSDGRHVVTASEDGTARVWDATSGQPLSPPISHDRPVRLASLSPDGKNIATTSEGGSVRVWQALTGRPVTPELVHNTAVFTARFSPDGRRLVTGCARGIVRVWDAVTGRLQTPVLRHDAWIVSARFSPDGRRIASGDGLGTARVWDVLTGQPLTPPLHHDDNVAILGFCQDGRRVATSSGDGTARMWDIAGSHPIPLKLNTDHVLTSAAWSPDGRRVVTAGYGHDSTAQVWDASSGQPILPPLRHKDYHRIQSAVFSADGKRITTASWSNTACVWDANDGKLITASTFAHGSKVNSVQFFSDSCHAVSGSKDNTARVWNLVTNAPITIPLTHSDSVNTVSLSADGRLLVTASDDNTARLWDIYTGRPLHSPLIHKDAVNSAVFSPDGRRVVTASADSTARVCDATTGRPITDPLVHDDSVRAVVFSPDGLRIGAATDGRIARVWDATTGRPVTPPLLHSRNVNSIEFSPDGRRVVTASTDETARVWDAATGQPVTPPLRHDGYVSSACFSPDGKRLLTACKDGYARIWELPNTDRPTADLIKLAHLYAGGRIDDAGGFFPLTADETKTLFTELKAKYPADFTVIPEQAAAWHREQLDAAAADKDWFAVAFHLRVLLAKYAFADVELARRLAAAEAELRKPAPAPPPAR